MGRCFLATFCRRTKSQALAEAKPGQTNPKKALQKQQQHTQQKRRHGGDSSNYGRDARSPVAPQRLRARAPGLWICSCNAACKTITTTCCWCAGKRLKTTRWAFGNLRLIWSGRLCCTIFTTRFRRFCILRLCFHASPNNASWRRSVRPAAVCAERSVLALKCRHVFIQRWRSWVRKMSRFKMGWA